MKLLIPAALLGIIFLSSCSSMYRTGQTPDDVYYSPARPASAEVRKEDNRDEYAYTEPDDNYLRMKVQNPNRWNTINDADYWYSYNRPYQYTHNNYNWNSLSYGYNNYPFGGNGYSYGYYSYNSPYYYNPGYYGGYYGGYHPGTIVRNLRSNTGPKPYMGGYTNTTYNNRNINYGSNRNNSGLGNTLRNVFTPSNSRTVTTSDGESYSRPVRTFTPSTPSTPSSTSGSNSSSGRSSSGSSSSSSSSSSGSSRPGRGN